MGEREGQGTAFSPCPSLLPLGDFARANGFGSTKSFRVKCQFSIHFETVTETDVSDEAALRGERFNPLASIS